MLSLFLNEYKNIDIQYEKNDRFIGVNTGGNRIFKLDCFLTN